MKLQLREMALSGLMAAALTQTAWAGDTKTQSSCAAKSGCKGEAKAQAGCKSKTKTKGEAASCAGEKGAKGSVADTACKAAHSCKGMASDSVAPAAGCASKSGCGGAVVQP